jgi:hypothetical protein
MSFADQVGRLVNDILSFYGIEEPKKEEIKYCFDQYISPMSSLMVTDEAVKSQSRLLEIALNPNNSLPQSYSIGLTSLWLL